VTDVEELAMDTDAESCRRRRLLVRVSVAAGVWALCYAIYRAYYAAGGTVFLPGRVRPGSVAEFRLVNLAGTVVIAIAAVLPVAVLPLWSRRVPRLLLLGLCWVVAVGCCMHALVDMTERVLSLTGLVRIHYPPLWARVYRREADLQDLFGNEPWFLVEGLAFGALGWIALGPGRHRRRWVTAAVAGVAALVLLGVLSMVGVIGRFVVG
jgi:hypothetical protein